MTVAATLPNANTSTAPPASSSSTPTPGYRWPAAEPAWQKADLAQLASAGSLSGVPPQIIAGISYYTSDYGLGGLGVNSSGYGGYFGESTASGLTDAQLTTPGTFEQQAQISAKALASYGHTPVGDLNTYATGTPHKSSGFTTWLEQNVFPGANASLTSLPWWTGVGALQGGGSAIGSAVGSAVMPTIAELLLVGLGGTLIILGLFKAAAPNAHPVKDAGEAASSAAVAA